MNDKILVKALDTYKKNNIRDSELNRIPKKGEKFYVTRKRLEVLLGNNVFKKAFVEVAEFMHEEDCEELVVPIKNEITNKIKNEIEKRKIKSSKTLDKN